MLEKILEEIGLEEKEAKIYLAALELGEASIGEISRVSGVKRTTIYEIIEKMIDSGYIKTSSKGKRKRFLAVSPRELESILERKRIVLNQVMPELLSLSNLEKTKPRIWFFEGREGLKRAFEETLVFPKSVIYQWASRDLLDILGEEWSIQYMKKRAKKEIFAKVLVPDAPEIRKFQGMDKEHFREIRLIDPERFLFEIELDVFGDRIAMISGKDKMAVIIESKPIANTLKTIHEMCWNFFERKDVKKEETYWA